MARRPAHAEAIPEIGELLADIRLGSVVTRDRPDDHTREPQARAESVGMHVKICHAASGQILGEA